MKNPAAIALSFFLLYSCTPRSEQFLQLPGITSLSLPALVYQIPAQAPAQLQTPRGTLLSIPARAFLLSGEPLPADALIRVEITEVFSPWEYLSRGVSLQTSRQVPLLSGGMVQVSADFEGQTLDIAPGQALTLSFNPVDQTTAFNPWFRTPEGTWVQLSDQIWATNKVSGKIAKKYTSTDTSEKFLFKKNTFRTAVSNTGSSLTNKQKSLQADKTITSFTVSQFGIFNWDMIPDYVSRTVLFTGQDSGELLHIYILGIKGRYYYDIIRKGGRQEIKLIPHQPALILALNTRGEMGLQTVTATETDLEYTIPMVPVPPGVMDSPASLRKFLGL